MATDDEKKRKIYFFPKMDIVLLKKVLQENPFKNGNAVYNAITWELKTT